MSVLSGLEPHTRSGRGGRTSPLHRRDSEARGAPRPASSARWRKQPLRAVVVVQMSSARAGPSAAGAAPHSARAGSSPPAAMRHGGGGGGGPLARLARWAWPSGSSPEASRRRLVAAAVGGACAGAALGSLATAVALQGGGGLFAGLGAAIWSPRRPRVRPGQRIGGTGDRGLARAQAREFSSSSDSASACKSICRPAALPPCGWPGDARAGGVAAQREPEVLHPPAAPAHARWSCGARPRGVAASKARLRARRGWRARARARPCSACRCAVARAFCRSDARPMGAGAARKLPESPQVLASGGKICAEADGAPDRRSSFLQRGCRR